MGVENARALDERLSQVMIDAPVTILVGVGQGAMGDAATNSQVVELLLAGAQASFYVRQAIPVSQLAKGHAKKLVPAGKGFDLIETPVAAHTPLELLPVNEVGQLRE